LFKNVIAAYKEMAGRGLFALKKIAKVPVGLPSRFLYVKAAIKAGLLNGIYARDDPRCLLQTRYINSKKWDYLVILDACRYDAFEKYVWKYMDGKLMRAISPGGYTRKWFKRTWIKNYKDIVYISANPAIMEKDLLAISRKFFRIVKVWERYWSKTVHTVPPWNMNKAVLHELKIMRIRKRLGISSIKRIVIHYIQPHFPYIAGPINFNKLCSFYINSNINIRISRAVLMHLLNVLKDVKKVNEILRISYEENLKLVLKFVAELISYLQGKVVITSDHGELLGEYGLYFHPINAYIPELRHVPLFIVK